MDKREQVIQLAKEIAETRLRLSRMEAQLDQLIAVGASPGPSSLMAGRADLSDVAYPWMQGSIASRILAYLNAHPGNVSTRDLFEAIGVPEDKQNSVLAALSRLKADGQIDWIDRGVYAAKAAQPL